MTQVKAQADRTALHGWRLFRKSRDPADGAACSATRDKVKELSGHMSNTTNNRMEIFAVIAGLGALKEPCVVEVYSDSAYTVNAFK